MSRRNASIHDEEEIGHNRPWVYFMIDAFFLVTQFFILTFHVRNDEVVLPQKMPPGTYPNDGVTRSQPLHVHVTRSSSVPAASYIVNNSGASETYSLTEFTELLAGAAQTSRAFCVRVSYDSDVPFGDVMPVFNACSKYKIENYGLAPLR